MGLIAASLAYGRVKQILNSVSNVLAGLGENPAGKVVDVEVPLAEMFGYATDLRSLSQGRATYTMEFLKYAETPASIAEAVIKQH